MAQVGSRYHRQRLSGRLASIVHFLYHVQDAAATYLARFAKLVRLALHGSVDGHHTLTEEMAMLENYLYLEQLRFRGKFEFAVRAEAELGS
ncbi:MAG: histidine kinase, partial [Saprospiraceae bacterium]